MTTAVPSTGDDEHEFQAFITPKKIGATDCETALPSGSDTEELSQRSDEFSGMGALNLFRASFAMLVAAILLLVVDFATLRYKAVRVSALQLVIHLEWHPRERKDRFPSVDERVRLYMSDWYLPPCNSSSQFRYKVHASPEFVEYAMVEIQQPHFVQMEQFNASVQISSQINGDRVINIRNETLFECAEVRNDAYCNDLYSDVKILGADMLSTPLLATFGDSKPINVMADVGLWAPLVAKYRGSATKRSLIDVTRPSTSHSKCSDRGGRKHLTYISEYQNELDYLSNFQGRPIPFAPIIWKLNTARHFSGKLDIARGAPVSWEDKIPKAIWRGTVSGRFYSRVIPKEERTPEHACPLIPRCSFVQRFIDSNDTIDAGFVFHGSKEIHTWANETGLTKDKLSIEEQLQYKILVSLQGNDVSSGLKWMLLSNSVVLMPPPTRTSWAMEELLQPFVHYVPMAEDGSDAEEKVQWILDNDMEAQRIAERSTLFMEDMLYHPDAERDELEVKKEIMRRYREHWKPF